MKNNLNKIHVVLYVKNQNASTLFYNNILRKQPTLAVPGMTEFNLSDTCVLGLMPNDSIAKIIKNSLPHPNNGNGIPRCELYLYVNDINVEFDNAIKSGAVLISSIGDRDWGDKACYFADPDGHVIAFAKKL